MNQQRSQFTSFLLLAFGSISVSACMAADLDPLDSHLRLNQIQVIGTHNSYHLAPLPQLLDVIGLTSADTAKSIDYSHAPLDKQFTDYGIRQIELDLYADPEGGLYSKPVGLQWLGESVNDPRMRFDFRATMIAPGTKIIHSPGFDFATSVPTLTFALQEIVSWSTANPEHVPILILLEVKESVSGPARVKPIPFDSALLDALDQEIRMFVPNEMRIEPDTIRGTHETLSEAVQQNGWPTLQQSLGKLMFALDNTNGVRDRYLDGHPSLQNRVLFVSVEEDHPAAAWMKINDPIRDFELIQRCVKNGLLVRTRCDADTRQARANDTTMRDAALASGAQFISTDYPVPDRRFSDYQVRFESGAIYRRNPVSHAR